MNEFLQIVSIYYGLGCIVVIGGAFVFLVAPFFYYTAGWKCKRDLYGIVGIVALLVISFLAAIAYAGPDGPPHLIPSKIGPQQEANETAKIEQRKQAEADLQSGHYKMVADCTPEELAYVNRIDAEQAAEKANAAVAAKCDAIAVTLAHCYPVDSDHKVGEFSYRSCNPHNHLTVYRTAVLMDGILVIPIVGMTKIYEEQPR